ncbi:hypothetical protein WJX79_001760 [Trebouxia sp. C0005]
MAAVNAEAAANKASALRAQKELKLTQDRLAKSERASEQARALLNGGAVTSGSVGQKRRDEDVGQVANTGGKRSKTAHAKSPSNNGQKRPFRSQQQRDWLKCKNLCWHCCLPGHSSPTCDKRGQPPAAMPAGFRQAKTAALAQSKA